VVAALAHNPPAGEPDYFIDNVLPFSVRGTYGGNSSCVEIAAVGEDPVICDLGTGVREFGRRALAEHGVDRKRCYHVFQSNLRWDHIMGFPFFAPAWIAGNRICIYACQAGLEEALRRQSPSFFPVDFDALGADIEFLTLEPGRNYEIAGFSVSAFRQFGDSYGYRFTRNGKTIVYSTDCEHRYSHLTASYPFVEFYRGADLLIFDAMYSLGQIVSVKEDTGHSSNIHAVELAHMACVKRVVLFHHEPASDDRTIEDIVNQTLRLEQICRRDLPVEVIAGYDGLELTV
jgi:phosphoribosyl 1,2-cyclic phosphodiesterase